METGQVDLDLVPCALIDCRCAPFGDKRGNARGEKSYLLSLPRTRPCARPNAQSLVYPMKGVFKSARSPAAEGACKG